MRKLDQKFIVAEVAETLQRPVEAQISKLQDVGYGLAEREIDDIIRQAVELVLTGQLAEKGGS